MTNNALITDCGKYRYWLTRDCSSMFPERGNALFVMLNPSTADANTNDATLTRCINFAESWGCASLTVANLYAYRATKPKDLWKAEDPIGPENNIWLSTLATDYMDIVCAWGANAEQARVNEFLELMKDCDCRLWCLGTTKDGSPRHPLYVKASQPLIKWN